MSHKLQDTSVPGWQDLPPASVSAHVLEAKRHLRAAKEALTDSGDRRAPELRRGLVHVLDSLASLAAVAERLTE